MKHFISWMRKEIPLNAHPIPTRIRHMEAQIYIYNYAEFEGNPYTLEKKAAENFLKLKITQRILIQKLQKFNGKERVQGTLLKF